MKRTRIKPKPVYTAKEGLTKNISQIDIFEQIWKERPHKCFVCDRPIYDATASNFAHVLSKAKNKYPKFKLNPRNIVLLCHDSEHSHHFDYDNKPHSDLKGIEWNKMFQLQSQLLTEYIELYGR